MSFKSIINPSYKPSWRLPLYGTLMTNGKASALQMELSIEVCGCHFEAMSIMTNVLPLKISFLTLTTTKMHVVSIRLLQVVSPTRLLALPFEDLVSNVSLGK